MPPGVVAGGGGVPGTGVYCGLGRLSYPPEATPPPPQPVSSVESGQGTPLKRSRSPLSVSNDQQCEYKINLAHCSSLTTGDKSPDLSPQSSRG